MKSWTEFLTNYFNGDVMNKKLIRLQLCAQQKVSPMTVTFCIASRI